MNKLDAANEVNEEAVDNKEQITPLQLMWQALDDKRLVPKQLKFLEPCI